MDQAPAAFDLAQTKFGLARLICAAFLECAPNAHLRQINVAVINIKLNIKRSGGAGTFQRRGQKLRDQSMKYQLQQKILDILDQCIDMTVATVRPDGAPQATVVSYVHDGLTIYFVCGASSQKATNMAHDPRVSVTVTPPYENWGEIKGLSIAAKAEVITDAKKMSEIGGLVQQRFPKIDQMEPMPADEIKFIRLRPLHISILNYSKGFGHTDLVAIDENDIAVSSESTRHRWLTPTKIAMQ